MGDLEPFSDETGGELGFGGLALDPAGVVTGEGLAGGSYGDTGQTIADPMDVFGYQAADAAEEAKVYADEALQLQSDWLEYIKSQYAPYSEAATAALSSQMALTGLSGEEAQAQAIADITASPSYQAQVAAGEEAVLRNAGATGGLRSGNASAALATINQDLLSSEIDAVYQQLAGLSGQGFEGQATESQYGTSAIDDITTTLSDMASSEVAQQAAQTESISGLASIVGSFFSDERLKTDVVRMGSKHGLPWYEWRWNSLAKDKLGLVGKHQGHMASEVEKIYPELVGQKDGFKTVNYGGFN